MAVLEGKSPYAGIKVEVAPRGGFYPEVVSDSQPASMGRRNPVTAEFKPVKPNAPLAPEVTKLPVAS